MVVFGQAGYGLLIVEHLHWAYLICLLLNCAKNCTYDSSSRGIESREMKTGLELSRFSLSNNNCCCRWFHLMFQSVVFTET